MRGNRDYGVGGYALPAGTQRLTRVLPTAASLCGAATWATDASPALGLNQRNTCLWIERLLQLGRVLSEHQLAGWPYVGL